MMRAYGLTSDSLDERDLLAAVRRGAGDAQQSRRERAIRPRHHRSSDGYKNGYKIRASASIQKQKTRACGPFAVAGARYGPISDGAVAVQSTFEWPS